MIVEEDDEVLLINSDGIIIRIKASNVSKLGRATQGVRIMRVKEDVNIIAVAKVMPEDPEELLALAKKHEEQEGITTCEGSEVEDENDNQVSMDTE